MSAASKARLQLVKSMSAASKACQSTGRRCRRVSPGMFDAIRMGHRHTQQTHTHKHTHTHTHTHTSRRVSAGMFDATEWGIIDATDGRCWQLGPSLKLDILVPKVRFLVPKVRYAGYARRPRRWRQRGAWPLLLLRQYLHFCTCKESTLVLVKQ